MLGQPQFPPPPVEKDISTLEELNKIGRDIDYPWDGIYHLLNDIDASETVNWEGGKGFKPIRVFTGKFYGQGHKIVNLYINRPGEGYVGLFGRLYGEVRDLGIDGAMVYGDDGVGGMVGVNVGTVTGCYSTGSVSGGGSVGGLVGGNGGTVSGCYSTGSVYGSENVGGLVGYNYYGTVNNSFAMGSVTGGSYIGGLIGHLESGSVTNTYSTSSVGGSGSDKGGLIGDKNGGTVTSSYWDTQTSGMTTSAGGTGKTTAQMKQKDTFIDWDFTNIWGIIENNTYPYLLWQYKRE